MSKSINNMLPGDELIAALHKVYSGPALEHKLEIVKQLTLFNEMYDEQLTLGEYEKAYIMPRKGKEFGEELD